MRTLVVAGIFTACASQMVPSERDGPRGPRASDHRAAARDQLDELLVRAHRAKAASLEADFEAACATLPFDKVSSSPFRRYAIRSWNTDAGVMLHLRGDVEPAELEEEVRCHRAWLMIAPTTTSDDSALDLPDLKLDIERTSDGLSVSVSVASPRLVPELRRRLARDLEVYGIIARSE